MKHTLWCCGFVVVLGAFGVQAKGPASADDRLIAELRYAAENRQKNERDLEALRRQYPRILNSEAKSSVALNDEKDFLREQFDDRAPERFLAWAIDHLDSNLFLRNSAGIAHKLSGYRAQALGVPAYAERAALKALVDPNDLSVEWVDVNVSGLGSAPGLALMADGTRVLSIVPYLGVMERGPAWLTGAPTAEQAVFMHYIIDGMQTALAQTLQERGNGILAKALPPKRKWKHPGLKKLRDFNRALELYAAINEDQKNIDQVLASAREEINQRQLQLNRLVSVCEDSSRSPGRGRASVLRKAR